MQHDGKMDLLIGKTCFILAG